MKTLGDLPLRQVPVIEPQSALDEAIEIMRAEPLKTVVLVGDEQFMGVFNEDAMQSNLIPADIDLGEVAVGPYVHPVRMTADPATPLDTALFQMRRRNVDLLPVVKNGTFYLGILTKSDIEAG